MRGAEPWRFVCRKRSAAASRACDSFLGLLVCTASKTLFLHPRHEQPALHKDWCAKQSQYFLRHSELLHLHPTSPSAGASARSFASAASSSSGWLPSLQQLEHTQSLPHSRPALKQTQYLLKHFDCLHVHKVGAPVTGTPVHGGISVARNAAPSIATTGLQHLIAACSNVSCSNVPLSPSPLPHTPSPLPSTSPPCSPPPSSSSPSRPPPPPPL